jgi:hypothetical protein
MRHPDKVLKIATMAANLNPEGIRPEVLKLFDPSPEAKRQEIHGPSRSRRWCGIARTSGLRHNSDIRRGSPPADETLGDTLDCR